VARDLDWSLPDTSSPSGYPDTGIAGNRWKCLDHDQESVQVQEEDKEKDQEFQAPL
jgi:hypothetical protein